MIEVKLPDGTIVRFPEGTSEEVMRKALAKLTGGAAPKPERVLATTKDGGRVIEKADGSRQFVGPGYVTSDPTKIDRILAGQSAESYADWVKTGTAKVGPGQALARSINQGLTFQFGDEAAAGVGSLVTGRPYGDILAEERLRNRTGEQNYPKTSMAGEVTGAVLSGVATGGGALSGAKTLTQRIFAGMGLGAAEGAAYEFGGGEGLADRADKALQGAAFGGVLGGLMPLAVSGAREVGRRIAAPMGGLLNVGNTGRAQNAMLRAFEESGASPADIEAYLARAAAEGQPEAVIADALGTSGQRALSGVTRQPGPARRIVTEFLDARQADQADRVSGFIKEALDGGDTAKVKAAELAVQRGADAKLAYDAARANASPVNLTGVVGNIDALLRRDPILGESTLKQGALGKRLEAFRGRINSGTEQLIDFDATMQIRTDLREYMEQNPRAKAMFEDVYDGLTEALRNASPEFQAANDGYRAASKVMEAVEAGKASNRPSVRADDVVSAYRSMTPEEQAAFRVGYADSLLQKVETARPGQNVADPLRSTRQKTVLGDIADNPDMLFGRIGRETDMFETRRIATGGSQTSTNLADAAAVNGDDLSIISNLATRPMTAGGQAIGRILQGASGMNEGTRQQLAEMLLSRDPNGLMTAIAKEQQARALLNVLEASGRGATRGGEATPRMSGLLQNLMPSLGR